MLLNRTALNDRLLNGPLDPILLAGSLATTALVSGSAAVTVIFSSVANVQSAANGQFIKQIPINSVVASQVSVTSTVGFLITLGADLLAETLSSAASQVFKKLSGGIAANAFMTGLPPHIIHFGPQTNSQPTLVVRSNSIQVEVEILKVGTS